MLLEPKAPHARCAVAILVDPAGRYLMQLRDDIPTIEAPGHWGLFGGGLEPGESFEDGLMRELAEELTFRPRRMRLVTELVYPAEKPGLVRPCHQQYFEVPVTAEEVAGMRQREGAGMAFFALPALLREPKVVPVDVFGLLVHARSRGR
jgi:8-oxo-dGTP pyrophosphatase MutT (NUDIX family)